MGTLFLWIAEVFGQEGCMQLTLHNCICSKTLHTHWFQCFRAFTTRGGCTSTSRRCFFLFFANPFAIYSVKGGVSVSAACLYQREKYFETSTWKAVAFLSFFVCLPSKSMCAKMRFLTSFGASIMLGYNDSNHS